MVLVAAPAIADWTDVDCSRWIGTPQYGECTAAHAALAKSDCSQWLKGGEEWMKCRHEHNVARVQECQRRGEARRAVAQGAGWDGIGTVRCPLDEDQAR
jgi:hypothetical protein